MAGKTAQKPSQSRHALQICRIRAASSSGTERSGALATVTATGDHSSLACWISFSRACTTAFLMCRSDRMRGGVGAGDAAERRADAHADAGRIAFAEHVAGHHLAGDEEIFARLAAKANRGRLVGFQAEIGERDARTQGEAEEWGRIERERPVSLRRSEPIGAAIVELRVIERAGAAGGVVRVKGLHETRGVESEGGARFRQVV